MHFGLSITTPKSPQTLGSYFLGENRCSCAPSMGKTLEVQVLLGVGHIDQSEAQGRGREAASRGSVERNRGSTYRNRIGGAVAQGERASDREALVAKGRRRKFGDRAAKGLVLTWGDLALRLKGRRRTRCGARSQPRS